MFGVKQVFVSAITFFGYNLSSMNPLEFVTINNRECKVRPEILNVNSNEPIFHLFSIWTSKCRGSCNSINDIYAKLRVPNVLKNLSIKVFNLMPTSNERRHKE